MVLRVVRNLCAGGPQQQDAFLYESRRRHNAMARSSTDRQRKGAYSLLAAGLPTTVVAILKTLLHHAPAAASAETGARTLQHSRSGQRLTPGSL